MATLEAVQACGGPALRLRGEGGASALVALDGAQLLSWRSADGVERLFQAAAIDPGSPPTSHSGVPIVFPQFGKRGPDTALPKHGFARDKRWEPVDIADALVLRLIDDEATRALWPHRFELTLSVRLAPMQLEIALACANTGDTAFAFTAALHSYLAVADIAATRLAGLAGRRVIDTTANDRECIESRDPLAFDGAEIDVIALDAGTAPLTLDDGRHRLRFEAEGLPDTVIWNPGPEKARALSDVREGGERGFVCIEAAAIATPVSLGPGASWRGLQRIGVLARP